MINLDPLFEALNVVVETTIGDQLKQTPRDAVGTLGPAIFRDRQKQFKQYPYATIELLSSRSLGIAHENKRVNSNDNAEYDFLYQGLFLISVFSKDNSTNLLSVVKQSLNFPGITQLLEDSSGNIATLNGVGDIIPAPDFLETCFEDIATMQVTLNFRVTAADVSSTVIDSVEIEQNLKPTEEAPPITNTFIVP